jgi:uncharacterized membrane protein YkvA (DUF1232 family)
MNHDSRDDRDASSSSSSPPPPPPPGSGPAARPEEPIIPPDGYERFRKKLASGAERLVGAWGRDAAELILFLPDLLFLFADLARDPRVPGRYKAMAGAVVAYLLSPVDLLPEVLMGPLGLADDVVIAFLALDLLLNRIDQAIVREHWRGETDLLELAQDGVRRSRRIVPAPLYDRLARWLEDRGDRKA